MKLLKFWGRYRKPLMALLGLLLVAGGTLFAIRWAKGYRPQLGKKGPAMAGTGLLVADSDPKGAQVFINSRLTTATDNTLNLTPGEYEIEIKKDGFISWKKLLQIKAELVTQTSSRLFPSVPNLTPLTFTGAKGPIPSDDGQKIVYKVDKASTESKNGLWVIDLTDRTMSIARTSEPRQIVRNTSQYNFLDANLIWSTDGSQLLAYWTEERVKIQNPSSKLQKKPTPIPQKQTLVKQAVMLEVNKMNDAGTLTDFSTRLPVTLAQWYQDLDLKDQRRLLELPEEMQKLLSEAGANIYFSPDEKRIMYSVKIETEIPENLIPDLPAESTQVEERKLTPGKIYVYEIKEDRNYRVGEIKTEDQGNQGDQVDPGDYWSERLANSGLTPLPTGGAGNGTQTLPPVPNEQIVEVLRRIENRYSPIFSGPGQWFPTSGHIIMTYTDKIVIEEYDGQNPATVYAGPFSGQFAYPSPNGNRLIIMTNFNDSAGEDNLYSLNLK